MSRLSFAVQRFLTALAWPALFVLLLGPTARAQSGPSENNKAPALSQCNVLGTVSCASSLEAIDRSVDRPPDEQVTADVVKQSRWPVGENVLLSFPEDSPAAARRPSSRTARSNLKRPPQLITSPDASATSQSADAWRQPGITPPVVADNETDSLNRRVLELRERNLARQQEKRRREIGEQKKNLRQHCSRFYVSAMECGLDEKNQGTGTRRARSPHRPAHHVSDR